MYIARIEVSFAAGHRLLGYPGKCATPHGHTYRVEVFLARDSLDELGLVMDFGQCKSAIKDWIERHWDHGFLLNDQDTALLAALEAIPESKLYLFRGINPSVEAIAQVLFEQARQQFGSLVQGVRVWESPGQYAEFASGPVGPMPSASKEDL